MGGPLVEQSLDFAVEMVHYCHWLQEQRREYVLSKQLLRSGTSIGANIHEANFAISRVDFVSKMQIALKEAHETQYWLTVMERTGLLPDDYFSLKDRCQALVKMLIAILNTSKKFMPQGQQRQS